MLFDLNSPSFSGMGRFLIFYEPLLFFKMAAVRRGRRPEVEHPVRHAPWLAFCRQISVA